MAGKQKRRSKISGIVLFALCAGGIITITPAQSRTKSTAHERNLSERNAQLDSIRAALVKGRSVLDSLRKQEGTGLAQLEQVESNITTADKYLRELSHDIDVSSRRLALLKDSLVTSEQTLRERQAIMKRRLRSMYITGLGRPRDFEELQVFVTSESITDALRRIHDFRALREYDRTLLAGIDSGRAAVASHVFAVDAEMKQLVSLHSAKEQEQKTLLAERAAQRELIAKVRAEKEAYAERVRQLEESQRKLRDIIETLIKQQRERAAKQAPAAKKPPQQERKKGAGFPWPLQGGTVVSRFGAVVHPVYKTTIMNNGIDIRASADPAVRSIASGTVVYVGSMRGLGRFAMVDHADGLLSIYARLSEISVSRNQTVTTGTVIGQVARGENLHFEIRRGTDPLDPMEWLE